MVFSLKNFKLKKALTGHRTQVTGISFCRNRGIFASISHDQLLVFNEKTLEREKMLKCATSTFLKCSFTTSGNVLATLFADGSLYLWDPEDYSHRESALAHRQLSISLNNGSTIAAFNV